MACGKIRLKDTTLNSYDTIKLSVWQSSQLTWIKIWAQSLHGKSVTNAIEFSRLAVPFKSTALASA